MPAKQPTKNIARMAGAMYLAIIVLGISSEAVIRSGLIIPGDAGTTAANILSSKALFRASFAADSLMLFADVGVAVLLYLLFAPAGRGLSLAAAVFRMTQAAILGMNLLNLTTALGVLENAGLAGTLTSSQVQELAMLFLDRHSSGYDLGLLFFGISNLLLGILAFRWPPVPNIIAWGLSAAGLVYLAGGYTRFIFPDALAIIQPLYIVPLAAELAFALWLLANRGNTLKETHEVIS